MITVDLMFELLRNTIKGDDLSAETLNGIPQEVLADVYALSNKHDLAHLIAFSLYKNKLIEAGSKAYEAYMYQERLALFRYENINYQLQIICDLFEKEKISHIPLKGAVIRPLYPEPWMRTSCDIDILIKKDDVDRAIEILKEHFNCKTADQNSYNISLLTQNNVNIELHFDLTSEEQNQAIKDVLLDVWNTSLLEEGYKFKYKMADEMYFFYHLAHMSKHFAGPGCGIRPFIDVWLLDKMPNIDKQARMEIVKRGGLDKFMTEIEYCAKVWMEKLPHNQTTVVIEDFILHSGIYGNIENLTISRQYIKGGKVRYAMSRIFLSYKELKTHYPVLDKHKWLYPFCQIRRWFKLLFCGGVKRSVTELKDIATRPQDKINEREYYKQGDLQSWGTGESQQGEFSHFCIIFHGCSF